jgi:hypothetical protein
LTKGFFCSLPLAIFQQPLLLIERTCIMQFKNLGFIILFLAILFILALPAIASPPLSIQGRISQGGVLFLKLPGAAEDFKACILFKDQSFPLFPRGQNLEGMIPLPADAKTGKHNLTISLTNSQNPEQDIKRLINIKPAFFPHQYLTLSQDNASKYEDPSVEREYKLIEGAFAKITPERLWQGNFILPCSGDWSTLYGTKRVVNGESFGFHRGVDIAAGWGTPVKASNSGIIVLTAENFSLHGKTIIINHGEGIDTLYLHLSKILVKPGQQVQKGEIIGKVGATGVGTGAHLHWGTYVSGIPVDPNNFLKLPQGWE